jgi:4-amino-4-deoxychorismate lyase
MNAHKLLLIETIKVQDGIPQNLGYHQARMRASRSSLLGCNDEIDLASIIDVPDNLREGIVKCRIIYGACVKGIEFDPYALPRIETIRLVPCDSIEYDHKRLDRSDIAALFARRGNADDILIVKHGLLTDVSFANIALFDGKAWCTPATPLLPGTKRQKLLDEGVIQTTDIMDSEIGRFVRLSYINAMLELDELSVPAGAIQV